MGMGVVVALNPKTEQKPDRLKWRPVLWYLSLLQKQEARRKKGHDVRCVPVLVGREKGMYRGISM